MNILQATARYYPAIGGVEDFVHNLSKCLVQKGHGVTALALDFDTPVDPSEEGGGSVKDYHGVSILRFKSRYPFGVDYPCSLALFNRLIRWKGDVIHAHCFWYFPGDAALLSGWLRNQYLIYTPYYYPANTRLRNIYLKIMKKLVSKARYLVAISRYEYDSLLNLGLPKSKLIIIPPGVDLSGIRESQDNIFSRFGLEHKHIVLSVCRLSIEKHVEVLVHAAQKILDSVPETHFVIIGPDFGQKEYLVQETNKLYLADHFTFTGPLPKQDVYNAYQHADVFCHMADGELFGITLVEAMAAGLPVIAVNTTAVPEIVKHKETGLLYPFGKSNLLAEHVIHILNNKKYGTQLANQGKLSVENNFQISNVTSQYLSLYQS